MNSKEWEILNKSQSEKKLDANEVVGILLKNRGITSKREREEFFSPATPENISLKTLNLSQLEFNKAITRIKKAIKNKEKVIVYGDYDADGISGTAILWETLWSLGVNCMPYIPERFSEGYGFNLESLKKLKTENPDISLIFTVDHGILANDKIKEAKKLGVDVVVTDHHTPGKRKPKAYSVIHTTEIGGAALAWILSREIKKRIQGKENINGDGLELAAIGTIADQLPLTGVNRSFVKYGLKTLNETIRPGLLALYEQSSLKKGWIGIYEVGFVLAPRINAMGRLKHGIESLRLLCTKDPERAKNLARQLTETNVQRQKTVNEVVLHAREVMAKEKKTGIIVLSHESYHEGVIGLAAAKIVEEFWRPAIILSQKGDIAKASARSIPGFNIIQAIREVEGYLIEGGGHPMAAGFSIKTENIKRFTEELNRISLPLLTNELLARKVKIDLMLDFKDLNFELSKILKYFEPVGIGNPQPVFATSEVYPLDTKLVGSAKNHLKLKLSQKGKIFEGIAFNFGEIYPKLNPEKKMDIAYSLEENEWNSHINLQLKIKDIKLSE